MSAVGRQVERLILKHGSPLILRKPSRSAYDAATQSRVATAPIDVEFIGFMSHIQVESSDGSVLYGDIEIRVSPKDFCDTTPDAGMFVVDKDTSYRIKRVRSSRVGSEIVEWVLLVRGPGKD